GALALEHGGGSRCLLRARLRASRDRSGQLRAQRLAALAHRLRISSGRRTHGTRDGAAEERRGPKRDRRLWPAAGCPIGFRPMVASSGDPTPRSPALFGCKIERVPGFAVEIVEADARDRTFGERVNESLG